MKIAFCESHARWFPHQSGYVDGFPSENLTNAIIAHNVMLELTKMFPQHQFHYIQMSDNHKCNCRSAGVCYKYNKGLREITAKAKEYDMAIQFHIDVGEEAKGHICLVSNSKLAGKWARKFNKYLSDFSGHAKRGKGVYDLSRPQVSQWFGTKHFIECGSPNAIIVELGVINSQRDQQWLESGEGVVHAVLATLAAFKDLLTEE